MKNEELRKLSDSTFEEAIETDVIIVGAGPTGLWLACELALANIRVHVVEKRTESTVHSRALTLHPRTLEVLDMRGIVERFVDAVPKTPRGHFAALGTWLDFSDLDTTHPYTAFVPQAHTEIQIEKRANELGVEVHRGHQAVELVLHDDGVSLDVDTVNGRYRVEAGYIVGCDGGRSFVREKANIDFPGTDGGVTGFLGDIHFESPPDAPESFTNSAGSALVVPLGGGVWRIAGQSAARMGLPRDEPLTLEELQQTYTEISAVDRGIHNPQWLSRFDDTNRLAETYRKGRVLLAGDAAHIHFPAGGVGLNVGVQDAMNLGWKMARVIHGQAAPSFLDTYHQERYPVGKRLCELSRAQVQLWSYSANGLALRKVVEGWLDDKNINSSLAREVSALGISYGSGGRIGERLPNYELGDGSRIFDYLHDGLFVLFDWSGELQATSDSLPQCRIVRLSESRGPSELNDLKVVLCRPDGHVAWASDKPCRETEVGEAMASLFGFSTSSKSE